ncbi:MAG TPA: CvpA family protein [Planctomycetota bacterium]|nr:CvpA family protein [Planctomycetota bacterium]HRR81287.1 CvpA family protein [Planctomycetota bacterium]HRT96007.1 CvpA family protein [Planctomycetota bacterium]
MGIDLIVLILVVLFVFLGYVRGLLAHMAGLGALLVASLATGFVVRGGIQLLASKAEPPSPALYAMACIVAWLLLYFVSRFLLGRVAKLLGSDQQGKPRPWNRKLGALAGAVEALVFAWFILGLLDAMPEDSRKARLPRVHQEMESSLFTNWVVRPTSPATRLELQPLIADLTVLSEHPEALRGIEDKPEIRKIAQHPKVAAVLQDQALLQTWAEGRYGRFFSDSKVREAVEDTEVRQMLRELPIRTILHEAAERARKQAH